MGRGLSDLQKRMLVMALENHQPERTSSADLLHKEVLAEVYRLPVYKWSSEQNTPDREYIRKNLASQIFLTDGLHPEFKRRYNAACAAISRAAARLQERGLVECTSGYARWAGINLTTEGAQLARQLTVKTMPPGDLVLTDSITVKHTPNSA